ncbi:nuclear transport factor 2 family protein [Siculibacillus lacustris]|uniref:nuclear transport factor 2 family protein n=1 Tax=Siculibacillus lacustris TaxID=1549641 RepID=UPI0013F16C83|nr:nuclear transport factor 2 family protein [Siculibacillus lacustris]
MTATIDLASDATTSVAAARALLDRWVTLFNAGDLAALTALYADDATLHGTTSPLLFVGRTQIGGYFSGLSEVEMGEAVMQALTGGEVMVSGLYDFHRPRGTRETRIPARFSLLVGERNGLWCVLHHHSSVRPERR